MGKVRRSTLLGLGLLLLYVGGCKVSCTTANISSLKFSKSREGTAPTNTFAAGDTDTIYAIATVSNNPGKVTLKFRLFAEKVEGQPENTPIPSLDVSVDVPGDGGGIYTLKPTSGAWPAGRYRVEVAMLTEGGEQKDQETGTFTVTGESGGPAPPTRPAATPGPAGGDTPEENTNESEDGSPDSEN